MKKLNKIFLTAAVLLMGLSLIACNDSVEIIPVTLKDVNGSYKGRLVTQQGPQYRNQVVSFTAQDSVMTFKEFPIEEIVSSVISDPVKAQEAVKAIGKVEYKINYTPTLNASQNVVELKLKPQALIFQIPVDGVNKNTIVTVAAKQNGLFVGQDWSLRFGLTVEKIAVDGTAVDPFEIIQYSFPYSLKY
ncbi:DUF4840 domain-containing protein [Chryseobacterium sp. CT-SW4]|uniref:DUF4840 domain-containing protein n=1 Tax=Chryseobacterium sp. SW-1 TaxID=3157343 RepID=UPI003B01DDEC